MSNEQAQPEAARLGLPSYVWRYGQDRRFALIQQHAPTTGKRVLDVGCGIGMYLRAFGETTTHVFGVDVEEARVRQAAEQTPGVAVAAAENLPFRSGSFDVVLLHEVIEHVTDDRQALHEAWRCLDDGGCLVIYAPNRWYPFETHGCYVRGRYRFGNIPLINYLPDRLRNRLCPHVRAYSKRALLRVVPRDAEVVYYRRVFPGYDNIVASRPMMGRWLRRFTYVAEGSLLDIFGLSHFLVLRKREGVGWVTGAHVGAPVREG